MKLDFFKCIDILMVAFVAIAWSQVCIAQAAGKLSGTPQQKAAQAAKALKQRNDKAACEDEARKAQQTAVKHPAKVTPYPVAYKKCMELRSAK